MHVVIVFTSDLLCGVKKHFFMSFVLEKVIM